ncbi:MAG TPA: hypothetical protein VLA29_09770 [Acidimicrobiia bacterium]|nr:hypothetical protein [Acidimicrobiia bacterium]
MTHSHSDIPSGPVMRYRALAAMAVLVALLPGLGGLGALVTTDRHIVTEDQRIAEDQYVTAVSSIVEGTIEGDLTVFSGSVTISGTVSGNLTAFSSGTVTITRTGSVGGSLQGVATALSVEGDVGDDVFFTAGSVVIEEVGSVGRDVIAFGGSARVEGQVGRDVRGRAVRLAVDGGVARDVDVATSILTVGPGAIIGGDILYRSGSEAEIASTARIGGTVTRLPAQGNFLYGVILTLANVVGFLGFVVAGLLSLWILRGVGSRAVGSVIRRPIRSLLTGIAVVVIVPLVIAMLAITLVGIPISIVLLAFVVVGFIIGPVPAVTALGNRVLFTRGGLFGAFLVGAVLWRLGIWLIPFVGGAIYVLGLVWGIGGWVLGAFAARRSEPIPPQLLPASIVAAAEATPDWEPPRAPSAAGGADPFEAWADASVDTDPSHEEATIDQPVAPTAAPEIQRDLSFVTVPVTFVDDHGQADLEPGLDGDDGPPEEDSDHTEDAGIVADHDTDVAGADPETLDEKLATLRTELETAQPEYVSDPAAERFEALREELASAPAPETAPEPGPEPERDPDSDPPSGGQDDWGLPRA